MEVVLLCRGRQPAALYTLRESEPGLSKEVAGLRAIRPWLCALRINTAA